VTDADETRRFEQLIGRFAPRSKVVRSWPLTGGVSARLTALEIEQPDRGRERMVVRRHGELDLAQNPNVAADEFRLLQLLRSAGLPVPRPYLLDAPGEVLSSPCIVLEFIDGEPETAPSDLRDYLIRLAECLIEIHQLDTAKLDLSFLRRRDSLPPKRGEDEADVRAALERVWPLPQRNEPVLLHGDFWPGNTLWKDGRLVAVVDWEDAAIGDPLADLANARLELLWAFGGDAMEDFTRHYRSGMRAVDFTDLAYWDLFADLRLAPQLSAWGLEPAAEEVMRDQHRLFTAQAFSRLTKN
jgi:aminoglycoside phosphotransferase (APT) family kinase protein